MIKWIKKLFSKKVPSNPYGIDERKLREAVNANLPIDIIKAEFPSLPSDILIKYIITGEL